MSKQLRIWLFVLLSTLLTSTSLFAEGVITLTTSKTVGEKISLKIYAESNISIEGVKESARTDGGPESYQLTNQTVTIRGNVSWLSCNGNQLTSLDVSGCTSLTMLNCELNRLTSLNVSGCTALTRLDCSNNQLTSLDVSSCSALTMLYCYNNRINGVSMTNLVNSLPYCTGVYSGEFRVISRESREQNQCRPFDISIAQDKNWTPKWSYGGLYVSSDKSISIITTSKAVGKTINLTIKANDNIIIDGVKESPQPDGKNHRYTLTSQTVTIRGHVASLDCSGNQLTEVDLSRSTALISLNCSNNQLTSLDVSGCTALTKLYCCCNQLTSLDVSMNTALTTLDSSGNRLASLDVSKNTALTRLYCYDNQLTSLDVSKNTALTRLYCYSNPLTSLDVSKNTALTEIYCSGNQLTSLDVSNNTALTELDCSWNQLTSLDVSKNTALTKLDCSNNALSGIDLLQCRELSWLRCSMNQIKASAMTALINSLPDRQGKTTGMLQVVDNFSWTREGNLCFADHVTKAKNWQAQSYQSNTWADYAGSELPTFAVTSSATTGGMVAIIGAPDLTKVPYGTELTVSVTPATGYELTSLMANKTDISASKKVIVKENLTIKATFAKKSFAVTFDKVGEGTITATGADDLNAVAYGTELTIVATPAAGYELQSLVAGGVDITATKKIVVKDNVTVKAIFAKKSYAVSLTKEGEGTITATGATSLNAVAYGTELTIVATPAAGYELTALTANGTDILASKKVTIKEAVEVKATFTKKSFAVTLSKEGEGTITATGATSLDAVAYGTELTINATPAEGYELTALTANGTDILATKKVIVKEAVEVKATFAKKSFAVSLTKAGEGTITATGATSLDAVPYGTELTINATPATGYELTALTANGTDILASKKVIVKEAVEVKATFTKKSFAVSLTKVGEGTITATGASNLNSVAYGTELTINATPAMGYELVSITAGGTDITASKKVVVTGNLTVKATFTKKSFAVSLTKEGEGTISATGAASLNAVAYGTALTINATPAEGYELTALTANGTDILATKKVVVEGNLTVKATFAKKSFAVSLTKEGEGTITATGASNLNSVAYGTELTINATPAEGYELTALTANGTDILATKKIVVEGNLTVKATFAKKVFAVSLTKEGEGTISATGASNLNSVAYGTELTIVATPAEGYELTALTANGTDILASKKIVVKDNLTVKATFTKKSFAISLTKEGEGTISATGASNLNSVAYGTELTINATPAEGYELTALTANGTDILATKKVVVEDNLTVKATFAKKSFAVSLTKEGEGTISATGASNLNAVAYGTELTIVATPAEGYELVSITAGGTDITASKKVVVKDNMTVKATFAKKSFAVSLTKEGEGTISATGASNLNSVTYGTELTIVATPAEGYELVSITAGGTDITASKKVVVTGNLTVKATFAKKNFAVSLTKKGEGMITATGASNLNSVAYGTELTINATPAKGYELVSITANGTDITATKKIVVKDNLTVKATFAKKSFAVSLTKEGEGTITATGASNLNSVAYGTELTIVATPAAGYELVSITAGGTDITASRKVVVTGNLTVKATFAKKNFAVSLTKEGEGTITATGVSNLNSVAYGTELTINATPAEGYELTALTANGTDILATKKVVVKDNLTVKATFAKKNFAVSLTKEGEGTISATGASNLNSVTYGTELTINATPAMGYELVTITAGGTDITASKKVVVTDNVTVKATFAKKVFAVSLTKEGEGTITATGASNLNSVAYGTELTINATPAEGYELTALTANGTDILATKKIVVEGNLTVKATFTKKTFAVTLTSNEHGDITIVEPVNLDAVPYGTTLTVKATGKNAQCVLTELTANGKDILATQSFVVTDVTEVKATFVDHTGVETTVTQQVKLYPNPATDYVIVEGVAPASEVTLHSMTGERLYAGRADDRGTLQIDLTPYADGVYLVCVAGETYRVVVRH